ncbi:hypothetical protein L3X38_006820 [Prunus dulcis]|uniref:Uncharacterized protein n=1 Tax=Prunus dulcis TaxID=3755 RepID=A0AAD5F5B9_PRUDU|nr:hypothetical protein L3X38_006820 [Prunus dulcis]
MRLCIDYRQLNKVTVWYQSHSAMWCECADEDVGSLKGGGLNSEVKRVGGWSNPRMGDHPGKLLRELPGTKPCGPRPKTDNIVLRRSRSRV